MKHTDEVIDRVLAGLRSVEPPTGMEHRLLLTLEQRAVAPVQARGPGWRAASWMLAGALTLVIGLAIVLEHPHVQPVRRALVNVPTPSIHITESQQNAPPRMAKRVRSQISPQRAGTRELTMKSFPAPPMPLTEQERLLLRVAHTGDPVELAMLDPEVLELEQEQRKRDFLAFFPPPPVLTQPAPGDTK